MEKKFNFTTALAMRCNAEQFESVIKEFIDYGYNIGYPFNFQESTHIVNNFNNDIGWVGDVESDRANKNNRIVIETFNRDLCLALATMTDKLDGIVGEWWIYVGESYENFTFNKIYRQQKNTISQWGAFIDNVGDKNGFGPYNKQWFRKATADELIKYFGEEKPFVLPEKWHCPYENREQFEVMKNYFKKTWIYLEPDGVHGCSNDTSNNNWHCDFITDSMTKITFDQFMKYVVGQTNPETDPQIEALQKRIEDLERNIKLLTTNMDKVIHQPEPKRYDIKTLSDIIDCTNESNLDNFLIDFKNLLILAHKAKAKGKKLNNAEFTWIDDGKNDILSYDIF